MTIIAKTSIKEQAYDIIRQKIYDQEYKPGDTVNITTLSKELGVSNTPIREALSRLEAEGLVTFVKGSKIQVVELNEKIFNETSLSFFVLIFGAYGLCKMRGETDRLLHLLDQALAEQKKALDLKDFTDFVSKAIEFDRCFVVATENEKMLEIYDSLASLLHILARHNHDQSPDSREKNFYQHLQIREAVAEGSLETVETLIFRHFNKHL